jgi:hypothetical protein
VCFREAASQTWLGVASDVTDRGVEGALPPGVQGPWSDGRLTCQTGTKCPVLHAK